MNGVEMPFESISAFVSHSHAQKGAQTRIAHPTISVTLAPFITCSNREHQLIRTN